MMHWHVWIISVWCAIITVQMEVSRSWYSSLLIALLHIVFFNRQKVYCRAKPETSYKSFRSDSLNSDCSWLLLCETAQSVHMDYENFFIVTNCQNFCPKRVISTFTFKHLADAHYHIKTISANHYNNAYIHPFNLYHALFSNHDALTSVVGILISSVSWHWYSLNKI